MVQGRKAARFEAIALISEGIQVGRCVKVRPPGSGAITPPQDHADDWRDDGPRSLKAAGAEAPQAANAGTGRSLVAQCPPSGLTGWRAGRGSRQRRMRHPAAARPRRRKSRNLCPGTPNSRLTIKCVSPTAPIRPIPMPAIVSSIPCLIANPKIFPAARAEGDADADSVVRGLLAWSAAAVESAGQRLALHDQGDDRMTKALSGHIILALPVRKPWQKGHPCWARRSGSRRAQRDRREHSAPRNGHLHRCSPTSLG